MLKFCQVVIWSSTQNRILSHTCYWRMLVLPRIGETVVLQRKGYENLEAIVKDVLHAFDFDDCTAFQHTVVLQLCADTDIQLPDGIIVQAE